MTNDKWLDGLTASMPVAEAAREALAVRFGNVERHVPQVLTSARPDVEDVHQLRVATRRARAALDIFESCLTAAAYRSAKKQLRKIRRAAGAARDWDVFLANLPKARVLNGRRFAAGRDLLLGYALAQRRVAQEQLTHLGSDYPDRFASLRAEIGDAVKATQAKLTLSELARRLLIERLQTLDQSFTGNLDDYGQLHQVRIAGKRLRYAMEVFGNCFGSEFREKLYPAVEDMQETLGDANDSHVALGHIGGAVAMLAVIPPRMASRCKAGLAAAQQFHEERLARQRQKFAVWQKRWQKLDVTALTTS